MTYWPCKVTLTCRFQICQETDLCGRQPRMRTSQLFTVIEFSCDNFFLLYIRVWEWLIECARGIMVISNWSPSADCDVTEIYVQGNVRLWYEVLGRCRVAGERDGFPTETVSPVLRLQFQRRSSSHRPPLLLLSLQKVIARRRPVGIESQLLGHGVRWTRKETITAAAADESN